MSFLNSAKYWTLRFCKGTEYLFLPFTLRSSVITVVRWERSDFDSAWKRPVQKCWGGGGSDWCGEQQRSPQCQAVIDVQRKVQKPMTNSPHSQRHRTLSPQMKVVFSGIWKNYYMQICSNISDVKWRFLCIWIELIKHIIKKYNSPPCHCNHDIWGIFAFGY